MSTKYEQILLDIKAVHLSPDNFFTWTSGIKSPIYCDNRQIISYPEYRNHLVDGFIKLIKKDYPKVDCIAGTATAGIPWAAWIADRLNLPMIYIRGNSKGHGLKNAIEGKYTESENVILIEDLISTGKSSIAAANEIINAKLNLLHTYAIFSYELDIAQKNFKQHNLSYTCLTELDQMLSYAEDENLLSSKQVAIIKDWKRTVSL